MAGCPHRLAAVRTVVEEEDGGGTALVVKGVKSIFKPTAELTNQLAAAANGGGGATVLGTFGSDKTPAAIKRAVGKGFAYYTAFLPGLSYYEPGETESCQLAKPQFVAQNSVHAVRLNKTSSPNH